jgi:spermidine/putrescine transport system permease protein
MSGHTATAGVSVGVRSEPIARRAARAVDRVGLRLYTALAIGYLLLPIAVMIVFSFNDPPNKFNFTWGTFSLAAWLNPIGRPGLADALGNSLLIATLSTLIATALGTLIALALARYQFRGRRATNMFMILPMATPEIVLGASLLTLFVGTAVQEPLKSVVPTGLLYPLGLNTLLIAHVMFNISYVVVTVRARLQGFPRHLEEAAMDLGANEWTTFWKVTFPLILPGILAASLLAFSLSIDDFIVSNFTSGQENTFPVWIWGTIRNNLPPQVNVIGTIIFVAAITLVGVTTLLQARSAAKSYREGAT